MGAQRARDAEFHTPANFCDAPSPYNNKLLKGDPARPGTGSMATVSSMPLQRPKKVIRYGKSSSRSTYSTKHVADFLDDESGPANPTALTTTRPRPVTVKASYKNEKAAINPTKYSGMSTEETQVKNRTSQVSRPQAKQDTFDVPSSDEEIDAEEMPLKRVSPPKLRAKRALVDDTRLDQAQLAPWEKQKLESTKVSKDGGARTTKNSGSQLETAKAQKVVQKAALSKSPPSKKSGSNVTSAAVELAARRQLASSSRPSVRNETVKETIASNKRTGISAETTSFSPRKRLRTSPPSQHAGEDAVTQDGVPADCYEVPCSPAGPSSNDLDVFDLPDDSTEESTQPQRPSPASSTASRVARRGKPKSSTRLKPKKGLSAPPRLAEMLPMETDSTDPSSRSPSAFPSTPRTRVTSPETRRTMTPPAQANSSPHSAARAAGALTPKQKQLWSQLLPSDPIVPTPSALAIKNLRISDKRRTAGNAPSLARTLTKSKSDVPEMHRRRTRLVDRLKASAPSSDDDESSQEDMDEELEDVEMDEPVEVTAGKQDDALVRPSQSQSQSQSAGAGPQITYARTRSYLPEDNLEDGLMFDLPSVTPQRPPTLARAPSKTNAASQKSAFDLEDSEEEGTTAKLRTIHELRAAGRNDRFMLETETLLEDVADHTFSGRSRRRSALIELANKLADKSYAERFVGQGFEHKLVAECSAGPDEVADFVLASALALLLASEPPQHTVTSLEKGGVIGWLAKLLNQDAEVSRMAKDRRNNMSKAAQGTLLEFATTMQSQQSLWDQARPAAISPRLAALKALELLAGRLRRLGDRTELLDAEQLQLVLPVDLVPGRSDLCHITLSVSLLESLSTSALALAWPLDVLERLAAVLPKFDKSTDTQAQTLFLAFRLTLNLTNDNARNCTVFANAKVVHFLLQSMQDLFKTLEAPVTTDEQRSLELDLLVLSMGIMINLAEHDATACQHTINDSIRSTTEALLASFQLGQKRIEEAESVEESTTNVAFGYLAVMLANICLDADARSFVAERLPGEGLGMLVAAVEEFVSHHQKVDMLSFEGEEGREVWGAFTERLRCVLGRLKTVADTK